MSDQRILVVDDEEDIVELVRYNLAKDGFDVECVGSGEDALTKAKEIKPTLIVLDLMLPGMSGLEVCKTLKSTPSTAHIRVVMLTAKGAESDIVVGLELGADDYVTKPFSPRILVARINAVLRRENGGSDAAPQSIERDGLLIDPSRHQVKLQDAPIELTATEFKLLHFLAQHPGRVFTRSQIVSAVHGDDYPVTDRSIDVQVVGLRKKLGSADSLIETVRGVGYRFTE